MIPDTAHANSPNRYAVEIRMYGKNPDIARWQVVDHRVSPESAERLATHISENFRAATRVLDCKDDAFAPRCFGQEYPAMRSSQWYWCEEDEETA